MQEMRWINFNMGCIETNADTDNKKAALLINFNMGCIETCQKPVEACEYFR